MTTELKPPPMSDAEINAVLDAAKVSEPPEGFEFLDLSIARAVIAARDAQWLALVGELQRDAERYRWLRHGDNDEQIIQRGPVAHDYVYLPRNEKLDEMIDTARGEKGGV